MTNIYSLEGKSILVTGASSGIGKAIAITCGKMGANVFLNGRNKQRLEDTLLLMPKGKHRLIVADLTDQEAIHSAVDGIPALDGIVHSAGIGHRKVCKQVTIDDINEVMNNNFNASVLLQSALLSKKKITKSASIVFIASRAANSPSIGNAIYSASKGAIISYSKCLALELAPRQIRVNCICPAMVWTNLILKGGLTKEYLEEAQSAYPLKRFGQPQDVANLAIFLLSDASSWMTGSCIDLTGGSY